MTDTFSYRSDSVSGTPTDPNPLQSNLSNSDNAINPQDLVPEEVKIPLSDPDTVLSTADAEQIPKPPIGRIAGTMANDSEIPPSLNQTVPETPVLTSQTEESGLEQASKKDIDEQSTTSVLPEEPHLDSPIGQDGETHEELASDQPYQTISNLEPPIDRLALLARANKAKRDRRHKRFEAIITSAQSHPYITNRMVRGLLHVSQSTATEYLRILVRDGKLRKEGTTRAKYYL